ncbi:hypothetical protein KKH03_01345, partial [Patescibacteria group bacterium]|nr:hypothetical protein [Patescibacteria group bacterium]
MQKTTKKILIAICISSLIVQIALATVQKQWPSTGSPSDIAVATTGDDETNQQITQTSDGNFIVTWARETAGQKDLYAQKISYVDGSAVWGSATRITNTGGINETPATIISNGNGGAYIVWNYVVSGNHCDIDVHQINSSGAAVGGFPVNITTDDVSTT